MVIERIARFEDITQVCNLIDKLKDKTQLPKYFTYDREFTFQNLKTIYDDPKALFLVVLDKQRIVGCLIAGVTHTLFTKEPMGTEVYWFVDGKGLNITKAKLRLLKIYEQWCKAQGCKVVSIGQTSDFHMDLTRLGYELGEKIYYRSVS